MKKDYDKIITRLTQILSRLYQGEEIQTKDLVEEFNVSVRTIQRDFKERLINFPIYSYLSTQIFHKKSYKSQELFLINSL